MVVMLCQNHTDVLIVGAGMVGLSIAWQLLERGSTKSITIIDKEDAVGMHGSGRNSGILHAGIYYEPDSLKARVCVNGAARLRQWCEEEQLPVLECGKIITPQKPELDSQLDLLLARGRANGAVVEMIDSKQFAEIVPDGRTSTGRALWSPGTCVVNPKVVMKRLHERLVHCGVRFVMGSEMIGAMPTQNKIVCADRTVLSYGHLFNSAGLQADRVAHRFGVGEEYTMLPFKGGYYHLRADAPFQFNTNLYPVPDLEFPFLGVHVTPSVDGAVFLGPTATPALGRENYAGMDGLEPSVAMGFLAYMARQVVTDRKMRRYAQEQAFQWLPDKFLDAAKEIVPKLELKHIEHSTKAGIRPQLYDRQSHHLVQDFVMLPGPASTHIINAISPAFTAGFELADHIIEKTEF